MQTAIKTPIIATVCVKAPKSGGGKFRHAVDVVIFDGVKMPRVEKNRAKYITVRRNVDARYQGPRSACGMAYAAARELARAIRAQNYADGVNW